VALAMERVVGTVESFAAAVAVHFVRGLVADVDVGNDPDSDILVAHPDLHDTVDYSLRGFVGRRGHRVHLFRVHLLHAGSYSIGFRFAAAEAR